MPAIDEPPKEEIHLSAALSFPLIFWVLCLSCVTVYIAVLPFNRWVDTDMCCGLPVTSISCVSCVHAAQRPIIFARLTALLVHTQFITCIYILQHRVWLHRPEVAGQRPPAVQGARRREEQHLHHGQQHHADHGE